MQDPQFLGPNASHRRMWALSVLQHPNPARAPVSGGSDAAAHSPCRAGARRSAKAARWGRKAPQAAPGSFGGGAAVLTCRTEDEESWFPTRPSAKKTIVKRGNSGVRALCSGPSTYRPVSAYDGGRHVQTGRINISIASFLLSKRPEALRNEEPPGRGEGRGSFSKCGRLLPTRRTEHFYPVIPCRPSLPRSASLLRLRRS